MPNDLPLDEFDATLAAQSRKRLPTIDDLKRSAVAKGINPEFASAIFAQESGGNWDSASSPKGALGGMQVMPATFRAMMGEKGNPDDPWDNLEAGLRYVQYGQKKLGTDDPLLLAAGYHQGYDRPELQSGEIADTNDGLISTRDYARKIAARVAARRGIRLDADGNQNPSQKLLKSWADDGLSIGEPILGTAAPVEATKTAAKDDKGWWSRNADYLVDDLKIGWNTLANAFDGWQAAQYSELFEANRAKYGDAPADPTVVENQTGLKAEYDRHMANVARRSAENQQISQRGRPETQQFFQAAEGKDFLEQASILGDALVKNPVGVITDLGIQSAPASLAMIATAVAARFGFRGPAPAVAAGGATSSAVEFGNDYADLRAQGKPHEEAWTAASIKSGVVGLFDAASMGSAGKALDKVLNAGFKGKLKEIGKEVGKQAALGASGEAFGTLASGRTPDLPSVAAEAVGEVFGAPGEAWTTFRGKRDAPPSATGGALPAADVLGDLTPNAPAPAAPGTTGAPAATAPTAPAPGNETAKAALLATPAAPDALARVDAIDQRLGTLNSLSATGQITPEAQAEQQALQQERTGLTANWPAMKLGTATAFSTEAGVDLQGQYALVDADALVSSHDENLRMNPAFPQQIQPRDRERAASELQVAGIVQKLNPARLGESADVANGAPIVGADGVVESGNARTIALKRVYQANGDTANGYRNWLAENAQRFGFTPEDVAGLGKPVLVRVRRTPVDRAEFARQANAPTTATMSPSEQAKSDAARIQSFDDFAPTDSGDFWTAENRDFLRRFVGSLPGTEQAALLGADGQLNQAGYTRVRNAVLARAYGDSPVLLRMVESMDNNLRNVTGALLRVAPRVAKARESIASGAMFDADLTDNVIAAVEELSRLRSEGQSVAEFLAQSGMFGDQLSEETAEILSFLDENIRSPKKIGDFIINYLDALAAAGNPAQAGLFGASQAPAKSDILKAAKERTGEQGAGAVPEGKGDGAAALATGTAGGGGKGEAQGPGNARPGATARGEPGGTQRPPDGNRQDEVTDTAPSKEGVVVSGDRIVIDGEEHDAKGDNFGQPVPPRALADDDPLLTPTASINTPERKALRDRIVDSFFEGKTAPTDRKPVLYLMGGGGGSGKGTIKKRLVALGLVDVDGAVDLDPDEIKTEHIPEYGRIVQAGDSRAAATTHEESSDLAKRVRERALKGGFDLVLDSTLGNAEKGMKIIADAKAAGYRVVLYGVTVDPRAAVVRASKRAKKSWRYVPVADLLKAHKGFANAFSDYLDAVDVGLIFDNSGTKPVVVAKKSADSKSAEIVNKEAYDRSRGYGELDETARSLGELLRPSRRDDGGRRGVGESQGGAGSRTDRAGQEEPGQERQAGPGGVPLERLSPDEEFQAALSDLGDWVRNNLTGGTVLKMFDEDMEANLAGILARLFTAALRLGHAKYEKARDYVLKQLKANPSTKVLSNKFTDAALRQAFMQAGGSDGNPVPGDGRQGAAGPGAGTAPKPQAARTPGRVRAGSGGPDLFGSDGGVDAGPKGEEPGRAPADGKGPGPQHGPRGGGGKGSGRPPRVPERRPANIKTGRNWRAADTDLTYEGSWLQKAKQNVDALRLLKTLEKEKRQASAEEQKVLAKYIGWGASDIRNQIFAPGAEYRLTGAWRELWRELKDTLTAEEWAEASRSTQYAHYTSKGVVRGMWRAMQRLGFAGGNIIEPGAGIGVFAGMMPGDVSAASTYTGIEFEPIAGAILKQLQPDELIRVESYVDSTLPENFYDVAIGNPPFHNTPILADPKYRKNRFALHDYFFAKTLDRVKPGGLMVFVTSRYTMDKAGDKARTWLAERADLVGAIRLPQTAFLKNAGTEVVTDVIFLRKKIAGQQWPHAQDWLALKPVKAGQGEESVNQYFADHPDMVLGTHAQSGTMYSANEYTVLPPEGDIEALFDAAVDRLPANVFDPAGAGSTSQTKANYIDWNPKAEKENSFYVDAKGVLMQRRQGVGHPVPIRTGKDGKGLFPKHAQILRDYIPLRDALKQAQYDQLTDGPWEQSLKALRRAYDAFTAKHGRVNQFTTVEVEETVEDENGVRTKVKAERYRYPLLNVIKDDPEWTLVMALETVNEEKGEIKDGHFLTDRVLAPPKPADIRTPGDALLASLNDYGRVNIDAMADRLGLEPAQVIEALGPSIYEEPSGKWITSDEYLSGDVVTKLEEAKAAAGNDKRFDRNVAALNDVQPAAITSDRITAPLGANWIPPDVYEAFAKEKLAIRGVKITYEKSVNFWSVAATADGFSEFGTHRVGASQILDGVLNARPLEVWDTLRFPDGSTKRQLNKAETEAANLKRTEMRAAFASWAWTDEKRTARLQDIYNSIYNRVVPRKFDGRHLSLPGTSLKWKVHPHVRTGAWRIVQQGNTYLAHAVGSGKTFTSIISAVEQKRLGLISKPMFVVPNHMLSQFSREFLDLYPAANIMVADEREFHTDRRRAFVARAALSNVDGIIITHSAFGLLDLDADFKTAFVNEQLEEMRAALMAVAGRDKLETNRKGQTVKSRDPTIRQIEGMIEKLEQRLESMTKVEGKDQNARFDEMGVDFLYVDEAHLFRKLDYHTARRVKGIDPNGSQRAFDLYMKTRWLEEKHPGRSLAMMSGTPITNTMAELYTVQRYLDPETLRKKKLEKFDAWANTFGAERTELEQDAGGNYVPVTRFGKFENVPELVSMFREFADVLTSTQLAALLPDTRPKVAGGTRSAVITPMTAPYREIRAQLRDRMETSKNWKPSFQEPNNPDPVIAIIGDGKLAAIDHRFLDPTADSDPDSKLNRMIDSLIRIHKETADMEFRDKAGKVEPLRGATQMVFADVGFGEGVAARRGFSARAWLMKRMTEAGIPREQIAFMSDYKKASEKLKLYQAMNTGKVRVLIGSSANMGTGVNAQQRLLALHHLDSPWYPADLEQREGRIVRQGNKNPVVQIYAYSMKGSYDETMWTMLARKQHFIEQALSGDVSVRSVEDVSEESNMAQIAAMTSGDPRTLKLAGLKAEIERLYRLWQAHENQQARLRSDKAAYEHRLGFMQRDLPNHEQVAAKVTDISGDAFAMRVGDTTFTKRKEAGQALVDRFRALFEQFHEGSETVGAVSGFPLEYQGYKQKRGDNVYYESVIRLMAGPTRPIVMSGLDADPVGVAMSLQYRLAEIERLPADMKAEIGELRAKIADVESRIGSKFQFSQELAAKQKERDELETDMTTHPSVEDGSPPGSPPQPKLSRQSPAPAGLSVSAVEGAISPVLARAKRLPAQGIRVVQSIADLPRNLRNFLTSANAESEVEGIYDPATKSVWLVADHLRTALRAEQVLFHELFGHFGLKGLFGSRMDAALRDLVARNANLRKRAATMRTEFGYGEALANEEAVVELAERGERMEGFHRFVAAMQKVLRDLGFTRLADWIEGLTDAEAMTVLAEARRFVRGERGSEQANSSSRPAMSRSGTAVAPAGTIDVDGVARPTVNSAGNRIADTDEGLRNFWRWFGDSKVVDDEGRPRVVYRGRPPDAGDVIGTPVAYFGLDRSVAEGYAEQWDFELRWDDDGNRVKFKHNVLEGYLRISNPATDSDVSRIAEKNNQPLWLEHRPVAYLENAPNLVEALRTAGYDGVYGWDDRYDNAGEIKVYGIFDKTQVKSVENVGTFDPGKASFLLSRGAGAQRANAILSKRRTRFTPLETLTRLAVRATFLDRITSAGYDRLLRLLNQITPERVKAGVVSDYGVPEAVIDRRIEMQGTVKRGFRETAEIIAALGNLTRAESRVAYQWMNADDPASSDYFMDQLPADSVKVLAEVEKWIDKLSEEAVKLGLMTPEVRDRHRFAYLRRSYLKHEEEASAQEKTKRRRAIAVLGDQFKGRGMVDGVEMTRIENAAPTWWKRKLQGQKADKALRGEEFIRLERLSGTAQASTPLPGMTPGQQKRKVLEVVYWPAAEAIPSKYSAWDYAGRWQVRDVKGSQAVMWRDFTAQERERMGEIDEVKYAVARTLHGMVHDVEAARYLKWVADQHSRATAQGITVVDASESLKRAFRPDEWVQVPDSTIAGTGGTKRYGALAGRYLPGPIWNDIRQTVGPNVQPLGEWYGNILRAWKVSKTALSPAVHTNNIMANFVMADWHDVRAAHIAKALEIVVRSKDPAHREIINRFEDAGGSIGTWSLTELQREQLEPLLAQLKAQVSQNGNGLVGAGAAIQLALSGKWKDAIAAASLSKGAVITQKVGKAMIDLYQAEDVVFRLAAFLRAKEEGADDRAAAKVARKSFLDYQINAPWIQLMRQTAFPFIAFTYRAAPMLLETAAKKPWKLAKMAVVLGSLNALGYALSGGDEDDERKLLPEEKAGKIFGFVAPKLIRMPWNDPHGSPVFLDVRRWIPVGDLADMGQTHAAVPILPVAVPAGPLAVFAEIAFNRSQFTGKEITKATDTGMLRSVADMDVDRLGIEQEAKVLDHLFKAFAPNIGLIPGTYAFTAVKNAATGRTDAFGREQSVAQAVASGVGVKVGSYPRDVLLLNETRRRDAQVRDIQENITALKREYIRRGITADEYGENVAKQQEKLKRINEAFKEKVAQ